MLVAIIKAFDFLTAFAISLVFVDCRLWLAYLATKFSM
jgi:hypothetical protein